MSASERLSKRLHSTVYTRIARSDVHGVGVRAVRPIPKGTNPFGGTTYRQELVPMSTEQVEALDEPIARLVRDFCLPDADGVYWVMPTGFNMLDVSFYLNHGKGRDANVEMVNDRYGTLCNFRATREIQVGEELRFDYSRKPVHL